MALVINNMTKNFIKGDFTNKNKCFRVLYFVRNKNKLQIRVGVFLDN